MLKTFEKQSHQNDYFLKSKYEQQPHRDTLCKNHMIPVKQAIYIS